MVEAPEVIKDLRKERACRDCMHWAIRDVPGTPTCKRMRRAMFNTPVSCWEGRQPGMPCGPDAKIFEWAIPDRKPTSVPVEGAKRKWWEFWK